MEPNILLVGRGLGTLEILKDELVKFQRSIFIANSDELIVLNLKNEKIDLIIVGAGLPTESKDQMVETIEKSAPNTDLHIMERTPGITPASMIDYTNEKAIMWKLMGLKKPK